LTLPPRTLPSSNLFHLFLRAIILLLPGDIDADGTVDASELNEVILRYRGE